MKRKLVIGATVFALLLGAVVTAVSDSQPRHQQERTVDLKTVGDVQPTSLSSDLLPCAAYATGLGLDWIGVYAGGPFVAWLSTAHLSYLMTEDDANKACQAESFYAHIGHQKLCWNAHFRFWADNGTAVFDDGLKTCLQTPATLDAVLCVYLPHGDWQTACYQALLNDYISAVTASTWGGIGAWLF